MRKRIINPLVQQIQPDTIKLAIENLINEYVISNSEVLQGEVKIKDEIYSQCSVAIKQFNEAVLDNNPILMLPDNRDIVDKHLKNLQQSLNSIHLFSKLNFTSALIDPEKFNAEVRDEMIVEAQPKLIETSHKISPSREAELAHDIRNTLMGIVGSSDEIEIICNDLLLKIQQGTLTVTYLEEKLHALTQEDKVISGCAHFQKLLVNDFLDQEKMQHEKLVLQTKPFALLKDIFLNIQYIFKRVALIHNINFKCILPTKESILEGDVLRITQVLYNLLTNAFKFAPNGEVVLKLVVFKNNENENLTICIKDNGVGIPKSQQGNLFKAFKQADTKVAHQFGGTGLGLSNCKKLTDLMQGDISYKSEGKDCGTEFTVKLTLPVSSTLSLTPGGTRKVSFVFPSFEQTNANFQILIVEDSKINAQLLGNMIGRISKTSNLIKIAYATNGEEAVQMITEKMNIYHLILIDKHMPVMNGPEAVKLIRQHEIKNSPGSIKSTIVAITGSNEEWPEVDFQLLKPINDAQLAGILESTIKNQFLNARIQVSSPAEFKLSTEGNLFWDTSPISTSINSPSSLNLSELRLSPTSTSDLNVMVCPLSPLNELSKKRSTSVQFNKVRKPHSRRVGSMPDIFTESQSQPRKKYEASPETASTTLNKPIDIVV